jgi:plasmid stabilization system protein ParE
MPFALELTRKAVREIDAIFEWLSTHSPHTGHKWYNRIYANIESLKINPERHGLAPESAWCSGEVRQLIIGKGPNCYRILFEIGKETVYILRIRHRAQSLLEPGDL